MQIHELNNYSGARGAGGFLAADDGTDTGKISMQELLSGIEEKIAELDADLNGRIDNIIAGGDAPSEAEVIDARYGDNGVTYPSLGDAIRGQIGDLKNELNNNTVVFGDTYSYQKISPVWIDGKYISTGGTEGSSSGYHYTKIRLCPGQCVEVKDVAGSGSVSLLASFETDGTGFTGIFTGNGSNTSREFAWENITDRNIDITITSLKSNSSEIYLSAPTMLNDAEVYNRDHIGYAAYAILSGYYNSSGTWTPAFSLSANVVTTPIFLKKGKRITVQSRASASVAQLIEVDKYGAFVKVLTMNINATLVSDYKAEKDMYVRAGGAMSYTFSVRVFDDIVHEAEGNNFNLVMPTIAFVFDDGTEGDANAVTVFKNHNKRCSFALISTVLNGIRFPDYLQYQADGFEILSHSTDARTMNGYTGSDITDESVAVKCMVDSKSALINAGFDIHGWVTPSGRLNPAWVNDVKKYYDYGFVLANVDYSDISIIPYYPRSTSAFAVFRVSLQTTTLAMCKNAVDLAIANNAMLVFYGHSVNETSQDNLTIASLDELLTYIETKSDEVQVLPCNTAMKYFFKVTHEDFISL